MCVSDSRNVVYNVCLCVSDSRHVVYVYVCVFQIQRQVFTLTVLSEWNGCTFAMHVYSGILLLIIIH